jgi:hypothetical protein
MMFVSVNSNTTGATCGAGTANPSGESPVYKDIVLLNLKCTV